MSLEEELSSDEDIFQELLVSWKNIILSNNPEDVAFLKRSVRSALENGIFLNLQLLFNNGYKIDPINNHGQTAIHLAFLLGRHEFWKIRMVFSAVKNDTNFIDDYGLSHFHISCTLGSPTPVENFIKNGEDVNHRCQSTSSFENYTPLLFAAKFERLQNVKLLLDSGADIDAVDILGLTSLHLACKPITKINDFRRYKNLFASSIDSNASLGIIQLLTERECKINVKDHSGDSPLMHIFSDKYYEKLANVSNNNKLLSYSYERLVIQIRRVQMLKLKFLLNHGADVKIIGNNGDTILHRAIESLKPTRWPQDYNRIFFNDTELVNMIDLLIQSGADVNALNNRKETPLQIAVTLLSADVVKILLENGADMINIKFNYKDFELFYYPTLLPDFEATKNLLQILELLSNKKRILTLTENLAIMRFFINNIDYSIEENDERARYKYNNILHYGTEIVIERFLTQRYDETLEDTLKIYGVFVDFIEIYANKEMKEKLREYTENEYSLLNTNKIYREIIIIKNMQVSKDVSLYKIMTMHPHKIYPYLKKRNGILNIDFHKKSISLLTPIIKGHITKSLIRQYVIESAIDYLRCVIPETLPDSCCEKILDYLTNEEIWNLCFIVIDAYENKD